MGIEDELNDKIDVNHVISADGFLIRWSSDRESINYHTIRILFW